MSFYVKQYYEQAVETHDHAAANYYTHDIQAKDDLNNTTRHVHILLKRSRVDSEISSSMVTYDTIYVGLSIGFNSFKNAFTL